MFDFAQAQRVSGPEGKAIRLRRINRRNALRIINFKYRKIPGFLVLLLLSCYSVTAGCTAFVAGAGTGTGAAVYTYKCGELKRSYQASFDKTILACNTALKSLNITIKEKTPDGIQTRIKGKCADKTSVTIKIKMIAPNITEISIRSGIIGLWDKKRSGSIHASIAQKLQ